jgi:hypothetical protein
MMRCVGHVSILILKYVRHVCSPVTLDLSSKHFDQYFELCGFKILIKLCPSFPILLLDKLL